MILSEWSSTVAATATVVTVWHDNHRNTQHKKPFVMFIICLNFVPLKIPKSIFKIFALNYERLHVGWSFSLVFSRTAALPFPTRKHSRKCATHSQHYASIFKQNKQIIRWKRRPWTWLLWCLNFKEQLMDFGCSCFFAILRARLLVHHKVSATVRYIFVYNLTCCVTVTMNFFLLVFGGILRVCVLLNGLRCERDRKLTKMCWTNEFVCVKCTTTRIFTSMANETTDDGIIKEREETKSNGEK